MEKRSKVAAETASVVPFHCVICFDEFCASERPPVVLPCGHTYVCLPCSKRLKRCMECREPLFMPAPSQSKPVHVNTVVRTAPPMYSRSALYSSQQPSTPPQPSSIPPTAQPNQIPLPIPKNVVLLSMMEAAERQVRADEEKARKADKERNFAFLGEVACNSIIDGNGDDNDENDDRTSGNEEDDEHEAFDLDKIISGLATLSGPCGTYAVRETGGLLVLPHDPRGPVQTEEEKKFDEDLRQPMTLERGQTVQVVDFSEGIAKLARGAGFVVATSSQLVKVGGPKEASCRLEGLLDTMKRRGEDLQHALDENKQIAQNLRKQLENSLRVLPSIPVITSPLDISDFQKSAPKSETGSDPSTPTESHTVRDISQPIFRTPDSSNKDFKIIQQDSSMEVDENGVAMYSRFPRSPNSIDNADIAGPRMPAYRPCNDDEDDLHLFAFGCGSALLGGGADLFGGAVPFRGGNGALTGLRLDTDVNRSSPAKDMSRLLRDSAAVFEPSFSSSFDTVDFRTGLSGHRALTTSSKSGSASPTPRTRVRMMMSEHRGIARLRGPTRRQQQVPSIGPMGTFVAPGDKGEE